MLSLVLPTYNEAQNLPELLPKIAEVLEGQVFEVIIVDDNSPDGTWKIARGLAQKHPWLRVIRRVGRRGLSSAVIEGFLAATGDVLVVMDADGQHDMGILPVLATAVKEKGGMAIGSRYVEGGKITGEWDERRAFLSRLATRLAIALCKVQVKDPMSGFFAIDRATFERALPKLNPKGFKILLDLLIHVPRTTPVTEVPFTFGVRHHGESKLSRRVQIEFIEYLYEATLGKYLSLTFVKYAMVGLLGVAVNVAAYMVALALLPPGISLWGFSVTVLCGIEAAIVFNFFLNNLWTFAPVTLTGTQALLGFIRYNLACLFGAFANYVVTLHLMGQGTGNMLAVVSGAVVGMIWNYTMSRLFTWRV